MRLQLIGLAIIQISLVTCELNCSSAKEHQFDFLLVRQCQRAATAEFLSLENTPTLAECTQLARELRGLALNYAPGGAARHKNRFAKASNQTLGNATRRFQMDARSKLSVYEQPEEFFNCHVLQCPQNSSFAGMVNDSRFDYYSLYGRPITLRNYTCVPEVGLFMLYTTPNMYLNASLGCSNSSEFSGSLAHIASERRTNALAQLLVDYNKQRGMLATTPGIFLAYVGLQYNRSTALSLQDFRNAQNESLVCFLYRAWDVAQPQHGGLRSNASCVALTSNGSWQTSSCEHKLPYICEIFRDTNAKDGTHLDIGPNAAAEC